MTVACRVHQECEYFQFLLFLSRRSHSRPRYSRTAGDSVEFIFEVGHFVVLLIPLYLTAFRCSIRVNAYGHHATCIAELTIYDVTGDAVQIFGSIGVACGDFNVEIDGGTSKTYNASRYQNLTSQLLFAGGNLGSGQHTLKLTNGQSNTGALVLDHSVSYTTMSTSSLANQRLASRWTFCKGLY